MKIKVIKKYPGEWEVRQFPTFPKGTAVTITGAEDTEFRHWFPCEIEGHETFVPESFIHDGKLIRDYNPTELTAEIGDALEVREIVNAWLLVVNTKGVTGWITAEAVVSEATV